MFLRSSRVQLQSCAFAHLLTLLAKVRTMSCDSIYTLPQKPLVERILAFKGGVEKPLTYGVSANLSKKSIPVIGSVDLSNINLVLDIYSKFNRQTNDYCAQISEQPHSPPLRKMRKYNKLAPPVASFKRLCKILHNQPWLANTSLKGGGKMCLA
jgi:hypothetical protein